MKDSASSNSVDSRISHFEKELNSLKTSQFLSMIRQHLSDAYCITDEEGMIIDVNDTYCHTLGYAKEELLTKSFTELLPQGIRPYALMLHHEYVSGQSEENAAEWTYEKKSGEKLLLRSSTSRLQFSANHTYKLEVLQKVSQSVAKEEDSMKKIMHQFKNTLQEIIGLLQLQAAQLEGVARQAVIQAQKRTIAVSIAYELLHKSGGSDINVGEYLSRLIGQFEQNCQLHIQHNEIHWQVNKVYALGIIITECLNHMVAVGYTNVLHLNVNRGEDLYVLEMVSEDDFSEKIPDLSRQLINALGRQLQAKIELQPSNHQLLGLQCPL